MKCYPIEVADATAAPTFFEHFRAFCDMLGDLATGEVRVIALLLGYADRNGLAFPSAQTMARRLKLSVRQVYRILRSLKQKGLIETVSRCGGSRGSALRRITMAQAAARTRQESGGTDAADEQPGQLHPETLRPQALTRDVRQSTHRTNHSTSPSGRNGGGSVNCPDAPAAVDDGDDGGNRHAAAVAEVLIAHKVFPHVARRLARIPHLRRVEVLVAARDARKKANPGAWLAKVIADGGYRRGNDLIEVEIVADLVNKRELTAVAGENVIGCHAKYNRVLYIYGPNADAPPRVVQALALNMKSIE
jgi:hypothetical protein